MTTILKVGGSVLTRKDEPETLDREAVASVAETIGDAVESGGRSDLVVVHGGGSFGHHHAEAHGVTETDGTRDPEAVGDVHGAVVALNGAVVAALCEAGVPALPVHPLSLGHRDATGALALPSGHVEAMLGEGFVPVLHGDVVVHAGEGATVLSGDEVVVSLADSLAAERIGLCTDVPGVLDASGTVLAEVDSYEAVASALGEAAATDVTGGMAGKVRRLLALDAPASVFDREGLAPFLEGGSPGTTVR